MTQASCVSRELDAFGALLDESMRHWKVQAQVSLLRDGPKAAILIRMHDATALRITQTGESTGARWQLRKSVASDPAGDGDFDCMSILHTLRVVRRLLVEATSPAPGLRLRVGAAGLQ